MIWIRLASTVDGQSIYLVPTIATSVEQGLRTSTVTTLIALMKERLSYGKILVTVRFVGKNCTILKTDSIPFPKSMSRHRRAFHFSGRISGSNSE